MKKKKKTDLQVDTLADEFPGDPNFPEHDPKAAFEQIKTLHEIAKNRNEHFERWDEVPGLIMRYVSGRSRHNLKDIKKYKLLKAIQPILNNPDLTGEDRRELRAFIVSLFENPIKMSVYKDNPYIRQMILSICTELCNDADRKHEHIARSARQRRNRDKKLTKLAKSEK